MSEKKSLDSEVREKESPFKAFLQYSAAPLAMVTALLSLLGWIYGTTYLDAWGLPERLFPLTREGSLVTGLLGLLLIILKNITIFKYGVVVLAVVTITTMVFCYKPLYEWLTLRLVNLFKPVKGRVVVTDTHDGIMGKIAWLLAGSFLILVFVMGLSSLWLWTNKMATESVSKVLYAIKTGKADIVAGMPPRARLYVKNDTNSFETYSGYMIETSSTHAALYTRNKGMVLLPTSQITKFEIADRPKTHE